MYKVIPFNTVYSRKRSNLNVHQRISWTLIHPRGSWMWWNKPVWTDMQRYPWCILTWKMQVVEQNVWNDPILSYNDSSYYYIRVHNILKSRRLYIMNYRLRCALGPGKEHKCPDWLCVQSECIAGRRGRKGTCCLHCSQLLPCVTLPCPPPSQSWPRTQEQQLFQFQPQDGLLAPWQGQSQ